MWIVEHLEECEEVVIDYIETKGLEIETNLPFKFVAVEMTESEADDLLSYPYITNVERESEWVRFDDNS